jgi:hypothetical protein
MKLPFVIDNRDHKLATILNDLLRTFQHRSMDVATAYFTVSGFALLKDGLNGLGSFRLLMGAEPTAGGDLGIRPDPRAIARQIRGDLESTPLSEKAMRLVEDLIAYLRRESVEVRLVEKGFLHAKCYLVYGDRPSGTRFLFERFQPLIGIVGSSNFTGPGLTSNRELNLSHRVMLEPEDSADQVSTDMVSFLAEAKANTRIAPVNRQLIKSEVGARAILELVEWYNREWAEAGDFKEKLIELLDASKFGQCEYTPYEIYMKALFEYFRDDLESGAIPAETRSAVDLAEFQEDAVKKARKILSIHHGVMIADSVGLGKTWIGKKLLEVFAYHKRQMALVVCPASLRQMWETELHDVSISAVFLSQEELGQKDKDFSEYGDVDVVLVDESHNFRNKSAQRYENLDHLLSLNGNRGRSGERKKIILLTATPINNDLLYLYHQINLIARNDMTYFASAGIGNLHRYFLHARREMGDGNPSASLFNLLEEVVIRRTRPFIKRAYPNATIRGEKIAFPTRRLKTENYDLEAVYQGIYGRVVRDVEGLKLAPYNLESYKKEKKDEWEAGREEALVGIFKSRYLKRLESSIAAFRISVRRALAFLKTFESFLLDGKAMRSQGDSMSCGLGRRRLRRILSRWHAAGGADFRRGKRQVVCAVEAERSGRRRHDRRGRCPDVRDSVTRSKRPFGSDLRGRLRGSGAGTSWAWCLASSPYEGSAPTLRAAEEGAS